jgi:hypothetical protein
VFAAAEKVPAQHAFSVEIRVTEKESGTESVWQGDAMQVVIGNTRRYSPRKTKPVTIRT